MPGGMTQGMPGTGYGAMQGMGMPPAAGPYADPYGTMPGSMGAGTMPMGGMPPMGMRPGANMGMGFDPEMNALLTRRLQELQNQLTLLNSEITMIGGETSPAARPLLQQRAMLQGQIRELEQQLNPAGANTPAMPGAMMPGAMMPGRMPPGMPGYGDNFPTPTDMMPRNMAPGMPGQGLPPGMAEYGMAGMPGMMGGRANTMMAEQLRLDAIQELQHIQQTLRYIDANSPVLPTIEARRDELLAQLESLNNQAGQTTTQPTMMPGSVAPGVAGSSASTLADSITRQPGRAGVVTNPRIAQMQNAERQMRAMGNTALADDLKRQIEQTQTQGFVEPQLPPGMPLTPNVTPTLPIPANVPANVAAMMPATLPQQGELGELQNTVDKLRSEISSLREEIRALQTLLRQNNQEPAPLPASNVPDDFPVLPTYTVE